MATFNSYPLLKRHVIMGVDPCGVQFVSDNSGGGFYCVSLAEIERLKIVGKEIGQRKYNYREYYDKERQGCLLKLASDREIISFDNYRMRRMKLAQAKKMGGVCVGEANYDLHPLHPRSYLQMAYYKLL